MRERVEDVRRARAVESWRRTDKGWGGRGGGAEGLVDARGHMIAEQTHKSSINPRGVKEALFSSRGQLSQTEHHHKPVLHPPSPPHAPQSPCVLLQPFSPSPLLPLPSSPPPPKDVSSLILPDSSLIHCLRFPSLGPERILVFLCVRHSREHERVNDNMNCPFRARCAFRRGVCEGNTIRPGQIIR